MMKVSETLDKTADIMEARPWSRGSGWLPASISGAVCLEGALALAKEFVPDPTSRLSIGDQICEFVNQCPAGEALHEYLQIGPFHREEGRAVSALYIYNDRAISKVQVVNLLRRAAEWQRAREIGE